MPEVNVIVINGRCRRRSMSDDASENIKRLAQFEAYMYAELVEIARKAPRILMGVYGIHNSVVKELANSDPLVLSDIMSRDNNSPLFKLVDNSIPASLNSNRSQIMMDLHSVRYVEKEGTNE